MTPAERYHFDTAGYLVLPDVLGHADLARYRARIDPWRALAQARREGGKDDSPAEFITNTAAKVDLDDALNHDPAFLDLVDHPRILPCIWDTVLTPRLKSSWLTLTTAGGTVVAHGNHTPWDLCNFYHADRQGIACHLLNVMWVFTDITPGGGGLTVIPGSHKAHFPVPPEGPDPRLQVEITAPAGSVVLFSHDLYHHSCNRSTRERQVLFLTYCPGVIANSYDRADGVYDGFFAQATPGTWRHYLLRRPHGYRELVPAPPKTIASAPPLAPAVLPQAPVLPEAAILA